MTLQDLKAILRCLPKTKRLFKDYQKKKKVILINEILSGIEIRERENQCSVQNNI